MSDRQAVAELCGAMLSAMRRGENPAEADEVRKLLRGVDE